MCLNIRRIFLDTAEVIHKAFTKTVKPKLTTIHMCTRRGPGGRIMTWACLLYLKLGCVRLSCQLEDQALPGRHLLLIKADDDGRRKEALAAVIEFCDAANLVHETGRISPPPSRRWPLLDAPEIVRPGCQQTSASNISKPGLWTTQWANV